MAVLSAAQDEEVRIRASWDQARDHLRKARAAVDQAQRDLDGLRDG